MFWLIGHLDRLWPLTKGGDFQTVNMRWAEDFMLEMLREPKALKAREPHYSRQSLAIASFCGGNFGEILGKMKSRDLYAILVTLWKESPKDMDRRDILWAFEYLEDSRAISLLLDALKAKQAGDRDEYRCAASALAKMGAKEAIPILLDHLDDCETYPPLSKYKDERILPAIKKALPELKDYALGAARLMVIDLEGGDRLPKLIELEKDPELKCMPPDPMDIICELKDKRAVPFAVGELNTSSDLHRRNQAICILASIKDSPEAIKALIDALDMDFQALAQGKNIMRNHNKEVPNEIAEHLKQLTGHDFGVNKKKWLAYYREKFESAK